MKINYVRVFVCFVLHFCTGNSTNVSLLRSRLMKDYKKEARPVVDHNSNTTVRFGLSLINVNLNDLNQAMEIVSILRVSWQDDFLQWDRDDEGVDELHFGPDDIWLPDVALFNSAKGSNISPRSAVPLRISSGGAVVWRPPFNGQVPCRISLRQWPRDTTVCTFRFGSWAHHGEQVDLQFDPWAQNSISLSKYEQSNKWKLVNVTTKRILVEMGGDKFIHLDFKIAVQRDAASHIAYVTHTAMAVMLCVLSSYLLPLQSHLGRLLLHLFGLSLLVICNIALYMSIPATGGPTPYVVTYYLGAIVLTTMSLICNVIMTTTLTMMQTSSKERKDPTKRTRHLEPTQELQFNYIVLEEELSEIPPREDLDQTPESVTSSTEAPPTLVTPPPTSKAFSNKRNLHKALNLLFLGMFSIAFILDYIVMKSNLSK